MDGLPSFLALAKSVRHLHIAQLPFSSLKNSSFSLPSFQGGERARERDKLGVGPAPFAGAFRRLQVGNPSLCIKCINLFRPSENSNGW